MAGLPPGRRATTTIIGPSSWCASPSTVLGASVDDATDRAGASARAAVIEPARTMIVPTPSYHDSSRPRTSSAAWPATTVRTSSVELEAAGGLPALGAQQPVGELAEAVALAVVEQRATAPSGRRGSRASRRAARAGRAGSSAAPPDQPPSEFNRARLGADRRRDARCADARMRSGGGVASSATARASSMIARPSRMSSSLIVIGGTTCSAVEVGERPQRRAACRRRRARPSARPPGPTALYGTSGSRVARSRTSSIAQNTPRPRTSPTDGWRVGHLGERRADDVGAEVAGVLDDALLLEDVDAGHGRGAGQRVAGVGQPAGVRRGRRTCRRCARLMTTPPSGT